MNELVSEKDLEKLKDYDRLKREYILLHEDYRRLLGRYKKQLAIQGVVSCVCDCGKTPVWLDMSLGYCTKCLKKLKSEQK